MSSEDDHGGNDDAAAVHGFHASLASFAFTPKPRKPNFQRTDSIPKNGLKRLASSNKPGIEVDSKPYSSRSPSPKKKKRGYAEPETYAHLRVLQDILTEGLDGTLRVYLILYNA